MFRLLSVVVVLYLALCTSGQNQVQNSASIADFRDIRSRRSVVRSLTPTPTPSPRPLAVARRRGSFSESVRLDPRSRLNSPPPSSPPRGPPGGPGGPPIPLLSPGPPPSPNRNMNSFLDLGR